MPYLTHEDKERLKINSVPKSAGDINFLINLLFYEKFKNWKAKSKIITLNKQQQQYLVFPTKDIKKILDDFIKDKELRYQRGNDVVGAVICAVFEFLRRNPHKMSSNALYQLTQITLSFIAGWYVKNVADYEDRKKQENGDCYANE